MRFVGGTGASPARGACLRIRPALQPEPAPGTVLLRQLRHLNEDNPTKPNSDWARYGNNAFNCVVFGTFDGNHLSLCDWLNQTIAAQPRVSRHVAGSTLQESGCPVARRYPETAIRVSWWIFNLQLEQQVSGGSFLAHSLWPTAGGTRHRHHDLHGPAQRRHPSHDVRQS